MKRKKWKPLLSLYLSMGFLLESCDPVYSIRIENQTNETATITVLPNFNFQQHNLILKEKGGNLVEFEVPAGEYIECGTAIAGLEDDLPFAKIKIVTANDSVAATQTSEILDMFVKNGKDKLETPYRIVIK